MRFSLGAFTALPRPRVSRLPTAPQLHIVRAGPEIQGLLIKIRRRTDQFISGFFAGDMREGYIHLCQLSLPCGARLIHPVACGKICC